MNTEHCYKMKISVHNKASLNVFLNTYELNVKKKLWGGGVRAKELVNKYRVELRQKSETAILYFFHAAGVLRTFVQYISFWVLEHLFILKILEHYLVFSKSIL